MTNLHSMYGQQGLHSLPDAGNLMSQGRPPDYKLPRIAVSPPGPSTLAPSVALLTQSKIAIPSLDRTSTNMPAELSWLVEEPLPSWGGGAIDKINPKFTEVQLECDGNGETGRIMIDTKDIHGISTIVAQREKLENENSNKSMKTQVSADVFNEQARHLSKKEVVATEQYTEKGSIDSGVLSMEDFMLTDDLLAIEIYISIMQVCRIRKDKRLAAKVHEKICRVGLETHSTLGNHLVPMFVDCGCVSFGQQASYKLLTMNEYSWTFLISGYIQLGQPLYAFDVYQQMQESHVHPSSYTLVTLLNLCAELVDIEKGWKVHAEVAQEEFEGDLFVGNALVDMYAKCSSLVEAWEAFDKMPEHDIVSWNALISGYAEHGHSHEAFRCFEELQTEGLSPNPTTIASILKACGTVERVDTGRKLHTDITLKGFFGELLLETALIDMYAKAGLLLEAQQVFNKLQVRDLVSWTALIAGYADHRPGKEAIECFERMHADSIFPNIVSYACVLKACGNDKSKGQEVHIDVVRKGYDGDALAGNSLVSMYAKLGSLDEAQDVFDKLSTRDVVSWNALISGYSEHGSYEQALFCFDQMKVEGIIPNSITYASVLKSCASFGAIGKGQEIHTDIASKGLEGSQAVGNSLISMYSSFSLLPEAQEVFAKLEGQNVVTWTAIMEGYAMNHDGKLAVDCFEDMQEQGVKADAVTLTCLLAACSHAGMVAEGYEYLKVMRERYGIAPRERHYSCIIDLFGRSGHLYEAEKLLETLCPPSDGTWAALLSACKTYGEVELGLRCFRELLKIDPQNAAWYILMKDIYASAGRWDDALTIEKMRKQTGAVKKLASVLIEVNKKVHEFVVGGHQSEELSAKLRSLSLRLKDEGHLLNVDAVLRPVSDKEKETAICEHAERLAIAFGLLHTPEGQTLRLTKNLRMCNDCHSAGKMISQIEKREIILRDDTCIHHFKDGLCLCKDMF